MSKITELKKVIDSNLVKMDLSEDKKLSLKDKVQESEKWSKKLKFLRIPIIAAALVVIIFLVWIFPGSNTLKVSAQDLMQDVKPKKVKTVELSEEFLKSTADFSMDLFKNSYDKDKNSLISPTSVYMALAMTANGADGATLNEFEKILGKYNLKINDLNAYYKTLSSRLTSVDSGKVSISNSIWYNDTKSLDVKKDFLQTNADYYNAAAYKSDFNSKKTVKDINNWVKFSTGKNIDKVIDKIDSNTMMYLINTLYFEDKWQSIYQKSSVEDGPFHLADGTVKNVDFMNSNEITYLKDDYSEGFIKPYQGEKYSFAALLPNEGICIEDYVNSLSGEHFRSILKNKKDEEVKASLPKFKSEYSIELSKSLKEMGLKQCFDTDKADFNKMASSREGNIFIDKVLHKTFIAVDTQGTKAGAVTIVSAATGSAPPSKKHEVILDRPFVYAIIDNKTNLPIFIGTMMEP